MILEAFRKNKKQQIAAGAIGVYLLIIIWKLVGGLLAGKLSAVAFQGLNIIAAFSLAGVPLLIAALCGDSWIDLGFSKEKLGMQILTGILIGLTMAAVLTLLPFMLGLGTMVYGGESYHSVQEAMLGLVYFLLPVGLVEEFVFRGFLFSKLDQVCISDGMPILISSVLFGLLHFTGLNFGQVLTTGLIGAFFCLCRRRIPSCTVLSVAIAHGIHDWLIRLVSGFF